MHVKSKSEQGFNRLELAILAATLVLFAAIALPVLARNKSSSEQAACFNNLRRLGHAFQLWANDHGDRNPWVTPVAEGGTFGSSDPLKGNIWFQMGSISNELANPGILVCPSDVGVGAPRKLARNFSSRPDWGFFNPAFRNNSVSYLIGLHSWSGVPRSVLSGDRNIRWDAANLNCSAGIGNTCAILGPVNPSTAVWTNAIHGETGNILSNDGQVEQTSSRGIQRLVSDPRSGSHGVTHFLVPN